MKRASWYRMACVLAAGLTIVACYGESETTPDEPETAAAAAAEESFPDPEPEQARQVEEVVRGWVTERVDEGAVYSIPPRGDYEVSGILAGFHTIHQEDVDTYYVCVDFQDGENVYDVDFFIDVTEDGLIVSDHYLHKVNGEAVE